MIARVVSVMAGALILSAVAHVTVQATGGYGTDHSYLTLAIAFGVGCGAVFCGQSWSSRRHALAVLFVICIAGGEAYGFLQTANRLLAGTEANQAPRREHSKEHARALVRVKAAKAAVDNPPTTSRQLEKAEAARAAADRAVVEKSAEHGCAVNCRQLLQAQVDAAAGDVKNARAALDVGRSAREKTLKDAEAALTRMKAPESPTPLADRSGVPAWIIDLTVAALGSIAANGLACCLMVFGAHRAAHQRAAAETTADKQGVQQKVDIPRQPKLDTRRSSSKPRIKRSPATEHAARFAVERLKPDLDAVAYLDHIRKDYRAWCPSQPFQLSDEEIGAELAKLFRGAGIRVAKDGSRPIAVGIALKEPDLLLPPM